MLKTAQLLLILAVGSLVLACGTGEQRDARSLADEPADAATSAETPADVATADATEESTATETPTMAPTNTPQPTATQPPQSPVPTRCAFTVLIKKGDPFEVIGPGSEYKTIPSPADWVRDSCTNEEYFLDPDTGEELPTTQVPTGGQ